jgi:hypothetical protein
MLTSPRNLTISGSLLILAASISLAASLGVNPESRLWLEGDSTLHPFTSQSSQLTVMSELAPGPGAPIPAILDKQALKRFEFSLPVDTLKSKEKTLDKNMYKALKAEKCPTIDFHMSKYEVKPASGGGNERPVQATGTLKIACEEKLVTLDAILQPDAENLRVKGEYTLKMTDYGVKPPTMALGTIRVKDKVVIHYDLSLLPK